MTDEWGPWIEHDGRGCPCRGFWVQAAFRSGAIAEGVAGGFRNGICWDWSIVDRQGAGVLIRYRIRKPRGMEVLERIVAAPKEVEVA